MTAGENNSTASLQLTRVALSLDALVVNGISYGVIQVATFPGFVDKVAGNLLRETAALAAEVSASADACSPKTTAMLDASVERLIAAVADLRSFRLLALPQVHAAAARVAALRSECVDLIRRIETELSTENRFYESRPLESAASIDRFLADLDATLVREWTGSPERPERAPASASSLEVGDSRVPG